MDNDFWAALDRLVATSDIVIDRPRGSTHPRFPDFSYPLDYGYLAGTVAADGGGIDVWVGSLPAHNVTGVILTLDAQRRDAEIKMLVGCTVAEAEQALISHQRGTQAALWVERPALN